MKRGILKARIKPCHTKNPSYSPFVKGREKASIKALPYIFSKHKYIFLVYKETLRFFYWKSRNYYIDIKL